MFDAVPPGQQATRIRPTARPCSRSSARAIPQPLKGMTTNCSPTPIATARGSRTACVVYVHEDEARRRSAHAERYVAAFEGMRAAGRACTFGDDGPTERSKSEGPDGAQGVPEDKAPSPSESAACPPRKGAEHERGAQQAKASWFDGLRSLFCCLWRS